jgi:hypothetical protein
LEARIPARLSPSEGRGFGLTVGGAFLVVCALLWFWRHREIPGAVASILGGLLLLTALAVRTRLGGVQRAWMGLAR